MQNITTSWDENNLSYFLRVQNQTYRYQRTDLLSVLVNMITWFMQPITEDEGSKNTMIVQRQGFGNRVTFYMSSKGSKNVD